MCCMHGKSVAEIANIENTYCALLPALHNTLQLWKLIESSAGGGGFISDYSRCEALVSSCLRMAITRISILIDHVGCR